MAQTQVVAPTQAQTETAIRWLRDEHLDELGGFSGFYCNRSIIRRAAREGDMRVLTEGRKVIGLAVFNQYGIDIFEIRPGYRRAGYGRSFAQHIIQDLFARGSTALNVDCVPQESERFWRALGFVDQEERYRSWGKTELVLRGPWPNNSFKPNPLRG